jgi:O-antigen ligase
MCGSIALTIFSNGWSLIGLGGIPLNRLLLIVVLFQFLLRAPGVARVPRSRVRNVHLLMCLTVLYALASAAASGTLSSKDAFLPLLDILGAVPFLVFFLAPSIFAGERERNLLLATLVGLGIYLGVTSIFEAIGPHGLVFPSYILQGDAISPGVVQAAGPFQSPVAEGFAAFACAVAAIVAFQRWCLRWQRYAAVLSGVTCLFACFATLERGVWVAAVAAAIVTAAATRTGRRWLIPGALACAIGVGAVLTVSSQLSQHTSQRANYEQSVWDRQNQMSAGIRMIEARPLLGFGWDRYKDSSEDYFRQPADYPMVGHTPNRPSSAQHLPCLCRGTRPGGVAALDRIVAGGDRRFDPDAGTQGPAPVEARAACRGDLLPRGELLRPARTTVSGRAAPPMGRGRLRPGAVRAAEPGEGQNRDGRCRPSTRIGLTP